MNLFVTVAPIDRAFMKIVTYRSIFNPAGDVDRTAPILPTRGGEYESEGRECTGSLKRPGRRRRDEIV